HGDASRRFERIARGKLRAHAGDAQLQARSQGIRLALQHVRAGAPGKAARIGLDIVDEVEHLAIGVAHDRAASNMNHSPFPREWPARANAGARPKFPQTDYAVSSSTMASSKEKKKSGD